MEQERKKDRAIHLHLGASDSFHDPQRRPNNIGIAIKDGAGEDLFPFS